MDGGPMSQITEFHNLCHYTIVVVPHSATGRWADDRWCWCHYNMLHN